MNEKPKITLSTATHRETPVVKVEFAYNWELIDATDNLKHKFLIVLIYSYGLRRSEARQMKPVDIDTQRMLVKVRDAKGKKDRYTPLAKNTLNYFVDYLKEYPVKEWLFEGRNNNQYSVESIYNVIKNKF